MTYFITLLFVPVIMIAIGRLIFRREFSLVEVGITFAGAFVICGIFYGIAFLASTGDIQILNGQITNKERVHGSYLQSYECHCHRHCSGSGKRRSCYTTCSTCYRKHYTVKWWADTTVGNILLDYDDSTSSAVYLSSDPKQYTNCTVGSPASIEQTFTNYIKAVPTSLFHSSENISYPVPDYPRVFDYYHFNHVVQVGTNFDVSQLNQKISEALKVMGDKNQVNIVIVLTSIKDKMYKNYLEDAWLGGKKNDVIVVINTDGKTINWGDAFTYAHSSDNEMLVIKLRDDLTGKNFNDISDIVVSDIKNQYKRVDIDKFDYLQKEIQPSDTSTMIFVILLMLLTGTVIYILSNNEERD